MKILRKIYNAIPLKIQIFSGIKKIFTPKFYHHLNVKGKFTICTYSGTKFKMYSDYSLYMEKEWFWKGLDSSWENISLKVWEKLLIEKDLDVVFDIGANTGIYSILSKAIKPDSKVHSFEPIPFNLKYLKKNNKLNDFDIVINEFAVSDEEGECSMFIKPNEINYMSSVNLNRYSNNTEVEELKIPRKSIDFYCKENNISNVDLVKIDTEEHETEVLKGMEWLLDQCSPIFLIEVIGDLNAEYIEAFFTKRGYIFYHINEKNRPIKVDKIMANVHDNYLFVKEEIDFSDIEEL